MAIMLASVFRGKFALTLKLISLAMISAILALLAQHALAQGEYAISAFLGLSVLALNFVYLTKKYVPLKFFLPGLLFLLAFVVGPVLYTVVMSGFQYQTGNTLSKPEAVEQIIKTGVAKDPNQTVFDVTIGKNKDNQLSLLYLDTTKNEIAISTEKSRTVEPSAGVKYNDFNVPASAPNFTPLTSDELTAIDASIPSLKFFYDGKYYLGLEGFQAASLYQQELRYDVAKDEFVNLINGKVYRDNGRGNYANVEKSDEFLGNLGWRAPIWFEQYTKLFTDSRLRAPFVSVFIWTVAFAALSVLTTFALGLLLALALNKAIRGRRIYRSILILPYAMPSVMSILIWGGMFDTEFGAINNLLGTDIAWFQNVVFARTAVILVNLWLGFPYFYLVSSGALQAIPSELAEAAAIDGASPRQIFNKITLPLLLKILSPLLIASFAFNFNNFNLIYLLTGGGPINQLDGEIAGGTDILISYTYKIAFNQGNSNLGLASAISVLIFILVASISLYGLKKSKVLDDFV
jgi:arabinogalactan oligomer/maltooligosaccharide transport system permease protein